MDKSDYVPVIMANHTAMNAVFHTPELMENILLCLDTRNLDDWRTLLLCQRVSRTFQATIAGSMRRLQKALWAFDDDNLWERIIRLVFGPQYYRETHNPRFYLGGLQAQSLWPRLKVQVSRSMSTVSPEQPESDQTMREWRVGSWNNLVIPSRGPAPVLKIVTFIYDGRDEALELGYCEFSSLEEGVTVGVVLDRAIDVLDGRKRRLVEKRWAVDER